MTEETYMTVDEVAALAHCHAVTVRRAIDQGELPAFKPRTRLLIRSSDVRAWIESAPVRSADARERARERRLNGSSSAAQDKAVAAMREMSRRAQAA